MTAGSPDLEISRLYRHASIAPVSSLHSGFEEDRASDLRSPIRCLEEIRKFAQETTPTQQSRIVGASTTRTSADPKLARMMRPVRLPSPGAATSATHRLQPPPLPRPPPLRVRRRHSP